MFEPTIYYCPVGAEGYDPGVYILDRETALKCERNGLDFVTLDVDGAIICNGVMEEAGKDE